MADYIVSARKYRPMTFDQVIGQTTLTTTLKNAIKSGKLAHAYLFCGPRGVGKTTCARIFAKTINCEHPTQDGEACNQCESCKAFNEKRSYNIFELDAASNNSVEDIKKLMEQTRVPPQIGKYKVFIIDEVHMLSQAAFNAFLKTLEEPPAHVIFILATTEKHKILPTIISRCQVYDFDRMTVPDTVKQLKMVADHEGITYEERALALIAEKADGGMRDALSIFDQAASFSQGDITYQKVIEDLNVLDADYYFKVIDLALKDQVCDIMLLFNEILAKGFDGGDFIDGLAEHVRNVMMAKDKSTIVLLDSSDEQKKRYCEQAERCTPAFLYGALKIMNTCDVQYRQSSNKRLLVELTLIEIAQLTQPEDFPVSTEQQPLKPIFKSHPSPSTTTPPGQARSGRQSKKQTPSAPIADQNIHTEAQEQKTTPEADEKESPEAPAISDVSHSGQPTPENTIVPPIQTKPEEPLQQQSAGEPSQQAVHTTFKAGNIGMSFQSILNPHDPTVTQKTEDEEDPTKATEEDRTFSQEQLQTEWLMMCNRMPQKLVGLAQRLKNISPKITEYPHIELVVDNEIFLEDVKKIQNRIKTTLLKDLHNRNLTLDIRLAKKEEVGKILTKRELFDKMRKDNPGVEKLRDLLDLDLN
ncbi:MAG: DNA polymerase III subunit gamma/tau [Prevotella sp.]|jgi:DNA polymerase-3 subunit gamma/tau|nr:DNA polymerase III subunit gamma/tau [Prevotella sp.]MCH4018074.1 DNA polymerase III subunit gamma/tau [Prevotella sp.]MCI1292345.1 DNA polymerase III subunit gamma/tau [Prevotella sp.]MCI1324016.1 DNA polymerase III subunit gamma/tau [Prevotella sp.]MCI1348612.1 DNA polymerase III subunit gamma/tau [Prevotella sp.]MCI1416417.1 DNA polymerase III subunit gamma/tau [Prevotella sp.]